jgi:hypothetical protein
MPQLRIGLLVLVWHKRAGLKSIAVRLERQRGRLKTIGYRLHRVRLKKTVLQPYLINELVINGPGH